MAKPKKKATKVVKKPRTKKPAAKKAPARRAVPKARLDTAARASMLRPGDSLNELIDETITAWGLVARKVRVPDVSLASLSSLGRKADKASKREADLAAKQAAKLAPLTDARIVTADAAYRAALKVKRIADAVGATDQDVADAFASITNRFKTGGGGASEPTAPTP